VHDTDLALRIGRHRGKLHPELDRLAGFRMDFTAPRVEGDRNYDLPGCSQPSDPRRGKPQITPCCRRIWQPESPPLSVRGSDLGSYALPSIRSSWTTFLTR